LKAVVLAGGFATRLRPLSCTRPKILFPIANKPLLQWTLERLASNRIDHVIMAVFHQTEFYIKQSRIPTKGLHITYSHDPLRKPLGTGGSIKKAEKHIGHNEPFIALNGDIFADINYAELLEAHKQRNAIATIALRQVKDPSRYGVAELAQNNRITRFIEKPPPGTTKSNMINAGTYVLNPEVLNYIPKGRAVSIEHEIFPKLAETGKLHGYVFSGLWTDIGKPEDYLEINRKMLESIPISRTHAFNQNIEINEPSAIDKKVHIGAKSIVGPYAVIGKNVTIGKNTRIKDSVIFADTLISDSTIVNGAIIGEGVTIEEKAQIQKNCIIGDHARIRKNVSLAEGTRVCPADIISKSVLTPKST